VMSRSMLHAATRISYTRLRKTDRSRLLLFILGNSYDILFVIAGVLFYCHRTILYIPNRPSYCDT